MKFRTVQLILSPILFPLAVVYGLVTRLRNFLFDKRILKSTSFDCVVISVGNLSAGGTGKTPFVQYLIHNLFPNYQLATLSRGYGRKTKGFVLANEHTTAFDIGDEPMMYHTAYGDKLAVAVGEDRALAIPNLLQQRPGLEIVLMDDAYQHRYVQPDFSILMTDYNNLFTTDYLLPLGMLRESRSGAKRADVVVVSKCPVDLDSAAIKSIEKNIRKHCSPTAAICFTTISDEKEVGESIGSRPVIVFSGIAQNEQFANQLAQKYRVLETLFHSDHHWYGKQDIERLKEMFEKHQSQQPVIVTTEKDFVRLQTKELKDALEGLPLCFIPIKVAFISGETAFLTSLKRKIGEK